MRRGDRDLLPYRLADSIVAQEEIPELSDDARERITRFHATWRELAGIATRVSLADLVGEIARSLRPRRGACGIAESRGGARPAAPGEAPRHRPGLPAGRRLARPRRLRRLPRLAGRGGPGRGRAARDRGERSAAAHAPPREGARVGRRLPPEPREGAHAPPGKGREQPDGALGAAAVRAPRRPPLPPASPDDEGATRPAPRRGGAAADVRRRHTRAPPARPLARLVLPRQHRGEGAVAVLGGGARDRARRGRRPWSALPRTRTPSASSRSPTRRRGSSRRRPTRQKSRGSRRSWSDSARWRRSSRPRRSGVCRRRSRSRRS